MTEHISMCVFFLSLGSSRDWAAKGPWMLVSEMN